MKLYLYCSSGSLLEYFTLNKMVCNDYLSMKNRKVVHSLGLLSNKFLFLTPYKLHQGKHSYGFEQDYMEIPAIIEFEISEADAEHWPVIPVFEGGKITDDFTMLSDILEPYIGVFVKAEVSFSYVSRIIFDNEDAKDDIYRPSTDLYFPEHLYDVVDESFAEDLDAEVILSAAKRLNENFVEMDVFNTILSRTKATSIVMNTILETRNWPFGEKYLSNFDAITLEFLGLSDRLEKLTDGSGDKLKDAEKDTILKEIRNGKFSSSLAVFFQEFIKELIPIHSTTFSETELSAIVESVMTKVDSYYNENEQKFIKNKIENIKDLVYGSSQESLETILNGLNETAYVLKALVFFLRSPNSCEKLEDGLSVYKAEPEVSRYAWIMFSALNGIEPIEAKKKSNKHIMKIAETIAMKLYSDENMVATVSSNMTVDQDFEILIERKLSMEDIHDFISSEEYLKHIPDLIKAFGKNKALSKGFKEKKYMIISSPSDFIKDWVSKNSSEATISVLAYEEFKKGLKDHEKKNKPRYDSKKFIEDYIRDKKTFSKLYKKDEVFWKSMYEKGLNK